MVVEQPKGGMSVLSEASDKAVLYSIRYRFFVAPTAARGVSCVHAVSRTSHACLPSYFEGLACGV